MQANEAEHYWDHYATEYDEEIASSIDEDDGTIKRHLNAAVTQIMDVRRRRSSSSNLATTAKGKKKKNTKKQAALTTTTTSTNNNNPVVVCDYGCGPGKWIKKLDHVFSKFNDQEYRIVGLDISQNLINMAKKKKIPTVRVAQANLEKLNEGIENDCFGYHENIYYESILHI